MAVGAAERILQKGEGWRLDEWEKGQGTRDGGALGEEESLMSYT